jgi:hypothetical protein
VADVEVDVRATISVGCVVGVVLVLVDFVPDFVGDVAPEPAPVEWVPECEAGSEAEVEDDGRAVPAVEDEPVAV